MAALAATLATAGAATAQPAKPTVEFRLRSVTDLFGKAQYVAGLAGQEDVVKQVWEVIKGFSADGKDLEGFDLTRPFGVYATLTADVADSPVVILVPVADRDKFLNLLKERAQLDPKRNDDGTYKLPLPEDAANPFIDSVYLRFANDYLYIGRTPKDLDPKGLIAPKDFFAPADPAVASLLVRVDTIPADMRAFLIGQLELAFAEQRKMNAANEDPAEKAALDFVGDVGIGTIKTLLEDAKDVGVRVLIDEKAEELSAELTLTAKPGTTLAKNLASLGGQTSLPAGIVGGKGAAARGSVKAALPADARARLGKLIDAVGQEAVKKGDGVEAVVIQKIVDTLSPTLKAAELDLAASLSAPDAKGRHTLLVAAAVKEGAGIEKLAKEFAPFAGKEAEFAFDVEKVGDFTLHKVTLKDVPPEFEKVFGTKTVWLATSDKLIAASIEPDGTALKAGLKAQAVAVPVLGVELSAAKLVPLFDPDLKPDELKALLKDTFGDGEPAGKDTVTITVTGGEKLTATAKAKGKAVQLLLSLQQFKLP
jgi:hypothetical protein